MALHAVGQLPEVILAQSAVAQTVTGATTETTLATIAIPAGSMGGNGQFEVITVWSYTNSANNKVLRVKLGATQFTVGTMTTTASSQLYTRVANRNSAASQVAHAAGNAPGFASSSGAVTTGTIDTSTDQNITITGQLALGTESITLESFIVKLFPKA